MTNPMQFPDGFVFGGATAAYQVEGETRTHGKGKVPWDDFLAAQGRFSPDPASDFYNKYPVDIDLCQRFGINGIRVSIAWSRIFPNGTGAITINGRDIDDYFGLETLKMVVRQPLNATDTLGKVDIVATVEGGGVSGQAGALRHGISRALLLVNPEFRPVLKKAGFLTRDPRMKERKKYGLKAARRAPQFSKR